MQMLGPCGVENITALAKTQHLISPGKSLKSETKLFKQGNQRWQTSPAAPPGIYRNFIWGGPNFDTVRSWKL